VDDIDQILRDLVREIDGALGAALGGMDGLLIAQAHGDRSFDLATVTAEHATILKNARQAYTQVLRVGDIEQVLITAKDALGFTMLVGTDYFVTIVLGPRGNVGKARLLCERHAGVLKKVLY
jgi:predicted regulator of Ras-like GTPase activity (Roadblock/LC7/MglB family)